MSAEAILGWWGWPVLGWTGALVGAVGSAFAIPPHRLLIEQLDHAEERSRIRARLTERRTPGDRFRAGIGYSFRNGSHSNSPERQRLGAWSRDHPGPQDPREMELTWTL